MNSHFLVFETLAELLDCLMGCDLGNLREGGVMNQ
jgi:hypothetical protein